MEDYKEPISRVQKRRQLRRLLTIMGGMILTFAIFIGGVMVGIRLEKERVRISQGSTTHMMIGEEKGDADRGERGTIQPSSEKKEEETRFTFYETLTKKERPERSVKVEQREAEKEGVSPAREQVKEVTKPPTTAKKDLYFIQVGSFREREKADDLRARLAEKGYKVHVIPVEIETVIWYRVRIGGFESLEEAHTIRERVAIEEHLEGARVVPGS